jgi:phage terminase large subunit-like protein
VLIAGARALPDAAELAMMSEAEQLCHLSEEDFEAWLKQQRRPGRARLTLKDYEHHWPFWARPAQRAPAGDWRVWLIQAGRGFGKTRAGAEWVRSLAEAQAGITIALVGASHADVRQVMVEGESGLLSIAPDHLRPAYEPSLRRLIWPNGATAQLYSAAEPDRLRGPQHHYAWCDEVAKWSRGSEAWNMLGMTMRLGDAPQIAATTTPRQTPVMHQILGEARVRITTGKMDDNRAHLPTNWRTAMVALHGGTRIGRQELDGEMVADVQGALFSRALIEKARVLAVPEPYRRVVVAVDPPASAHGDACGIVVAAIGADGLCYVLADCTVERASPDQWARAVAGAAEAWGADRVVAEANNGGAMVEATLRAAALNLPVKLVHASRGKVARAEPVLTLFEAGRARLAGAFPELEDQLCGFITGGGYEGPGRSPDRADACVWAVTELMLGRRGVEPRVRGL